MNRLVGPARLVLALFMVTAGIMHFLATDRFAMIVPDYLPWPRLLVQVSGMCEIALGLGLLIPALRPWAGWGLIALYAAVFPANVHMAVSNIQPLDFTVPTWALWARLPMQAVFVAWAYWVSRR